MKRIKHKISLALSLDFIKSSAGEIRTPDLWVMNPMLLPTELPRHMRLKRFKEHYSTLELGIVATPYKLKTIPLSLPYECCALTS